MRLQGIVLEGALLKLKSPVAEENGVNEGDVDPLKVVGAFA